MRRYFQGGVVVLAMLVSVGFQWNCSITATTPEPYRCQTDLDCFADQICQNKTCTASPNGPTPPPPPPKTDSGSETITLPDQILLDTWVGPEPPNPDATRPDPSVPDIIKPEPPTGECKPGLELRCYNGPVNTRGRGVCKDGKAICGPDGRWGPCVGEIQPTPETCNGKDDNCDGFVDENNPQGGATCLDNNKQGECKTGKVSCSSGSLRCIGNTPSTEVCDQKDNDCDGQVDEGNVCGQCVDGEQRPCFSGPFGCKKQASGNYLCTGECRAGKQICRGGKWGTCEGEQLPLPDTCNDKDDDCDGGIDENSPCRAGQTRPCYTGPAGTEGKGLCQGGVQFCSKQCAWETCRGEVTPTKEDCTDGKDNDCDGQVDNCTTPSKIIITSLTPPSTQRGTRYQATIVGTGFSASTTVEISSAALPTPTYANITTFGGKTTFQSATSLAIDINPVPSSLTAGPYLLRVNDPANGISAPTTFLINNQSGGSTPVITSLTPNTAKAGSTYTGVFTGTGFDVGATVEIKAPIGTNYVPLSLLGNTVTITRNSSTSLTLTIQNVPATIGGISLIGTHNTRITNPNGKSSNIVGWTIQK